MGRIYNNFVAKHAYKYNKSYLHNDKTKAIPRGRVSDEELEEYYAEKEERNSTDTNDLCSKIN
jgi:hypothetical protein